MLHRVKRASALLGVLSLSGALWLAVHRDIESPDIPGFSAPTRILGSSWRRVWAQEYDLMKASPFASFRHANAPSRWRSIVAGYRFQRNRTLRRIGDRFLDLAQHNAR